MRTCLVQAILDCGDLPGGGTVVVPSGLVLYTASLFMRSNLTLRVEAGTLSLFYPCTIVVRFWRHLRAIFEPSSSHVGPSWTHLCPIVVPSVHYLWRHL